jgi:hypothetical protein
MGLFDVFHHKEPAGDPLAGGADGFFDVLDGDGRLVRYAPDDFDEIWTTTDEHEAGHHVSIGWILLDEVVGAGDGPGRTEFRQKAVYTGGEAGAIGGGFSVRSVPVEIGPDNVTTFILGYLKPGRRGTPQT